MADADYRLLKTQKNEILILIQQPTPSGPGLRELFAAAGHLLRHVLGGVISPPCSIEQLGNKTFDAEWQLECD